MGLVYEAHDPNIDRLVAVKIVQCDHLPADLAQEYAARFKTETQAAGRLVHPNIVTVYDAGFQDSVAYLVMELVEGEDLDTVLSSTGPPAPERCVTLMRELLAAVQYAHRAGVLHRDIKPGNILIDRSGAVKLGDFGAARISNGGDFTRTRGTVIGTLRYMAPEQIMGQVIDERADLFACGVVLYQMLTGARPFSGTTEYHIIQQILYSVPQCVFALNPRIPHWLDGVAQKALSKDREARYQSAAEFIQALGGGGQPDADSPTERRQVPRFSGTDPLRKPPNAAPGSGSHPTRVPEMHHVLQEIDLFYWKEIKDSGDTQDFIEYLEKFPGGIYTDIARRKIRLARQLAGGLGSGPVSIAPQDDEQATRLLKPRDAQEPDEVRRQAEQANLEQERRRAEDLHRLDEARAAEVARQVEAMEAERQRIAADARRAEEARLAEEARRADEQRQLMALRAEETRKASEEAHRAEEIRKADAERLAEQIRHAAKARQADEARKAEESRRIEDARKALEREQEQERARAKRAEEARQAELARRIEEAREADEARQVDEARRAAIELRLAEEARITEAARKAEETRRVAIEQRIAEEARRAAEARQAAESRRVEESRKAVELRRAAEAHKEKDAREAQEATRVANQRGAEEALLAEARQAGAALADQTTLEAVPEEPAWARATPIAGDAHPPLSVAQGRRVGPLLSGEKPRARGWPALLLVLVVASALGAFWLTSRQAAPPALTDQGERTGEEGVAVQANRPLEAQSSSEDGQQVPSTDRSKVTAVPPQVPAPAAAEPVQTAPPAASSEGSSAPPMPRGGLSEPVPTVPKAVPPETRATDATARRESARAAAEKARQDRERADALRLERDRAEAARADRDRVEAARLERERAEAARAERDRDDAARLERERERERTEAARVERERAEAARLERERTEAARLERERIDAARIERERVDAARVERERAEAAKRSESQRRPVLVPTW